ncbi:MAG: HAD-IC family P-type ATPase, partial [Acidimicrobiales bacterium]
MGEEIIDHTGMTQGLEVTHDLIETPWQQTVDQIVAELGSDATAGLSEAEVRHRLATCGPNVLKEPDAVPAWRKFVAQFRDPLVVLLLAATVISFIAWLLDDADSFPVDAAVIIVIVLANAAIGLWQEHRAEQAVAALQSMTTTQSRVVRQGEAVMVPSHDLVPGDLLIVAEGDAVGADARLTQTAALAVAEAPLTGESEPVSKQTDPLESVPVGDRTNMVFNGTAVASGRGVAIVTSTGMDTEMGHIAGLLDQQEDQPTPLQNEIARVS